MEAVQDCLSLNRLEVQDGGKRIGKTTGPHRHCPLPTRHERENLFEYIDYDEKIQLTRPDLRSLPLSVYQAELVPCRLCQRLCCSSNDRGAINDLALALSLVDGAIRRVPLAGSSTTGGSDGRFGGDLGLFPLLQQTCAGQRNADDRTVSVGRAVVPK